MAHAKFPKIDSEAILTHGSLRTNKFYQSVAIFFVLLSAATFYFGISSGNTAHTWGVYFVNVIFWLGLACGGIITATIFQIVRAKWSVPFRRFSEANIYFVPLAVILLLLTYYGKAHLFPWANKPMPGREWWMQAWFVYSRLAVLFCILTFVMWKFVGLSLKSDQIFQAKQGQLVSNSLIFPKPATSNVATNFHVDIQRKLSYLAPVLVALYVIIYSLFVFEMIMSMDKIWYSNLFGAFFFVGNIYIAWACIYILSTNYMRKFKTYANTLSSAQFWDLGKLCFGFSILWAYTFFSQYLPQWYGNLPEETAWMIARTRGTWMPISYLVLGCCFVLPFVLLLSRDVKKTPSVCIPVCLIILFGVLLEKYVIVMPQLFPNQIPFFSNFGVIEIGITLGFASLYYLCVSSFLAKFPFIPVSHPITRGSVEW